MKILIIDDSRVIHLLVKEILAEAECAFDHAFNGQEGLDKLEESPAGYDLILLDWEMPKLTGPDTLVEIKRRGYPAPVVMMTSRNAPADIASLLNLGAAEYIIKPFTKDIVINKIASIVNVST
jgi:two-component system chemotaxis response regulator CheY